MPRSRVAMVKTYDFLSSRHNPLIRKIRTALSSDELTPDGLLPIEGAILLQEAIKSDLQVDSVFALDPATLDPVVHRCLKEQRTRIFQINKDLISHLVNTESPQGVIALVRLPSWNVKTVLAKKQGLFLALVSLQDPGNLGTIIRSAEAFRVSAIFLTPRTVSAYNSKVVRASAGSILRVPIISGLAESTLLQEFSRHGITTVATSPKAKTVLTTDNLHLPLALFVGQEAQGLPGSLLSACNHQVRIPISDSVQSLNAAMATGILLYEIRRHEQMA